MSLPTAFFGLIKAAEGEPYDLDVVNNNLDQVDLGLVKIDTVNSTANWTNFSFLNSTFTRVRISGGKGIVIAQVLALVDVAAATPINTQTGDNYGNVAPAGFRPKRTLNYSACIQSGNGRGDTVQCALSTNGDWFIRSNTGTAFTTTANATVNCHWVYEWDGNL